jgi:Cu(I)/Ag(I) efflux system membrane fusion protein
MRKPLFVTTILLAVAVSFLAGYLLSHRLDYGKTASDVRRVLYYVDPMNPGHRYEKPGIAPCGMALEPVYSDQGTASSGTSGSSPSVSAGFVRVSPKKQQIIGIRVVPVEKAASNYSVRLLGRVAPDATRLYVINASYELWVRKVSTLSSGDFVKRGEFLMAFYNTNFLSAAGAYMYALSTLDKYKASQSSEQMATFNYQVRQAVESLQNLGVSDIQIREMEKTRKMSDFVDVRSPTNGIILNRNVSLGQWAGAGTELYRIADLSRVWILVDTYENEARYFKPGQNVSVSYQGKVFSTKVSKALPLFDAATRTLKVRLEAENPGYVLRPDMFVDVEQSVAMPAGITVPVDAIIDSGLKKTVFVDRGNGYFEARKVETGRYLDDRVEILKGLQPGERIVVSGNFLIDSESRMKTATAAMSGTGSIDPSCGMMVDEGKSKSERLTSEYRGKLYYFCSRECKMKFDKSPAKYAERPAKMDKVEPEDMKIGVHRND